MTPQKSDILRFSVIFIGVSLALVCRADDRARDRASLRGIQAVVVRVHTWEPDWSAQLEKVGLTESILQAVIERRLESNGLPVVSEEASKKSLTEGVLNVRIRFSDPEPPPKSFLTAENQKIEKFDSKKKYVYAIRLNFRQMVSLQRDPTEKTMAITWQTESLGMRRLSLIREDVENTVDVFIEAFLSENPAFRKAE